MGFYTTETCPEVADLPLKNRVGVFRRSSPLRAGRFAPQPVETVSETAVTFTITVSGLSFWLSRDPIGEMGGLNLYGFVENNPANDFDAVGLAVHLSPWNGEAENLSASATVTIQGDWAILTFTKGTTTVVKYPWSEASRSALLAYYAVLPGWSSVETIGSGTHSLGSGKTMSAEWTAGTTRIVDSDFLTASTVPVYEPPAWFGFGTKCCKLATLPVKIGWNVLKIHDCPSGINGVYYEK